jgi:mRNA-degrading endonuclease RelE of RelBE toxin-antitoxin system
VTYEVTWSRQAKQALSSTLPESVAAACLEFVLGPLAESPRRVGKPLRQPHDGLFSARRGEFRVIYQIHESRILVHVVSVRHRRDAYRT